MCDVVFWMEIVFGTVGCWGDFPCMMIPFSVRASALVTAFVAAVLLAECMRSGDDGVGSCHIVNDVSLRLRRNVVAVLFN